MLLNDDDKEAKVGASSVIICVDQKALSIKSLGNQPVVTASSIINDKTPKPIQIRVDDFFDFDPTILMRRQKWSMIEWSSIFVGALLLMARLWFRAAGESDKNLEKGF